MPTGKDHRQTPQPSSLRVLRALPVVLLAALPLPARADEVVVFAASSLKTALDAVALDFEATTGHQVTISYGGSGALARQIIQGAPADIFLSAAPDWMDEVEGAGLLAPGTRRDLYGNQLVLIAHGRDAAPVAIVPGLDLAGLLGGAKLSMAMTTAVPAGQYGRQAFESLGLWSAVEPFIVQSENVRAALVLVALGEAAYGITYATDAAPQDNVTVVGTFPSDSHDPIIYPGALLVTAKGAADAAFFEALSSDLGDAKFAAEGFEILN